MAKRGTVTVVFICTPLVEAQYKGPTRFEMFLAGLTVNGAVPQINKYFEQEKLPIRVHRPAYLSGQVVPTGTNPVLQPGDILKIDP